MERLLYMYFDGTRLAAFSPQIDGTGLCKVRFIEVVRPELLRESATWRHWHQLICVENVVFFVMGIGRCSA